MRWRGLQGVAAAAMSVVLVTARTPSPAPTPSLQDVFAVVDPRWSAKLDELLFDLTLPDFYCPYVHRTLQCDPVAWIRIRGGWGR